jgi:hypothetical protein
LLEAPWEVEKKYVYNVHDLELLIMSDTCHVVIDYFDTYKYGAPFTFACQPIHEVGLKT